MNIKKISFILLSVLMLYGPACQSMERELEETKKRSGEPLVNPRAPKSKRAAYDNHEKEEEEESPVISNEINAENNQESNRLPLEMWVHIISFALSDKEILQLIPYHLQNSPKYVREGCEFFYEALKNWAKNRVQLRLISGTINDIICSRPRLELCEIFRTLIQGRHKIYLMYFLTKLTKVKNCGSALKELSNAGFVFPADEDYRHLTNGRLNLLRDATLQNNTTLLKKLIYHFHMIGGIPNPLFQAIAVQDTERIRSFFILNNVFVPYHDLLILTTAANLETFKMCYEYAVRILDEQLARNTHAIEGNGIIEMDSRTHLNNLKFAIAHQAGVLSLLGYAALLNNEPVVRYLIEQGAGVNEYLGTKSLLTLCLIKGLFEMARFLVANGAIIESWDGATYSLLQTLKNLSAPSTKNALRFLLKEILNMKPKDFIVQAHMNSDQGLLQLLLELEEEERHINKELVIS